jgi:hypothetical protein
MYLKNPSFSYFTFLFMVLALSISQESPVLAEEKNDCVVRELTLAHGVKNREPVLRAEEFTIFDKRIYAYARLDCRKFEGRAELIFYRNGKRYFVISEKGYPSRNYRTWAYVTAREGKWKLELHIDGILFAEVPFIVRR